jgi:hypothetical protein
MTRRCQAWREPGLELWRLRLFSYEQRLCNKRLEVSRDNPSMGHTTASTQCTVWKYYVETVDILCSNGTRPCPEYRPCSAGCSAS